MQFFSQQGNLYDYFVSLHSFDELNRFSSSSRFGEIFQAIEI